MHQEILKQNPGISYKQLRSLERMDAKKEREIAERRILEEGVKAVGQIGSSALDTAAAYATGVGGYVLSYLFVNWAQQQNLKSTTTFDLRANIPSLGDVLVSTGLTIEEARAALADYQKNYPFDYNSPIYENVRTGPVHDPSYERRLVGYARKNYYIQGHTHNVPLMSAEDAAAAHALMTVAAASGVAGSLLAKFKK